LEEDFIELFKIARSCGLVGGMKPDQSDNVESIRRRFALASTTTIENDANEAVAFGQTLVGRYGRPIETAKFSKEGRTRGVATYSIKETIPYIVDFQWLKAVLEPLPFRMLERWGPLGAHEIGVR